MNFISKFPICRRLLYFLRMEQPISIILMKLYPANFLQDRYTEYRYGGGVLKDIPSVGHRPSVCFGTNFPCNVSRCSGYREQFAGFKFVCLFWNILNKCSTVFMLQGTVYQFQIGLLILEHIKLMLHGFQVVGNSLLVPNSSAYSGTY